MTVIEHITLLIQPISVCSNPVKKRYNILFIQNAAKSCLDRNDDRNDSTSLSPSYLFIPSEWQTVYFLFNALLNNTQPRISCRRPAFTGISETNVISTHPSGIVGAAQTDLQNVDMNNADASRPSYLCPAPIAINLSSFSYSSMSLPWCVTLRNYCFTSTYVSPR